MSKQFTPPLRETVNAATPLIKTLTDIAAFAQHTTTCTLARLTWTSKMMGAGRPPPTNGVYTDAPCICGLDEAWSAYEACAAQSRVAGAELEKAVTPKKRKAPKKR